MEGRSSATDGALTLDGREGEAYAGGKCLPPVLICLLGGFLLLKNGMPVSVRSGGRTEALLAVLGLRYQDGVPRDVLLTSVWPDADPTLSSQALNSLVHSLHKQIGDALCNAAPVIHSGGGYCLNFAAGVDVDVRYFESLAQQGDRLAQADPPAAMESYSSAVALYRGDLATGDEDHAALIERERLRARHLTLLARLAEHYHQAGNYERALDMAQQLLRHDPCREDAHRLVMRCYVRRGERSQALRQFDLCSRILRMEFDAGPEPATRLLYDAIRLDPGTI